MITPSDGLRILCTGAMPEWAQEELESSGHEVVAVEEDAYVDEEKFRQGIQGFDVYILGGKEICTRSVIQTTDRLKAIIFLGIDYQFYINQEAALEKKISIFNTPEANVRAVAEHTFLLIMLAARKGARLLADTEQKVWRQQDGYELKDRTLGLIGGGRIATEVAHLASGFGMKVVYWSRSGPKASMPGEYRSFDDVLSTSDLVSLHVPQRAGTLIDANALKKMRPHVSLINTARAKLVDADALHAALSKNELCSAAFDVFYSEGPAAFQCPASKLHELGPDKFIQTPHTAWRTIETTKNLFKAAISHIRKIGQKGISDSNPNNH